MVNLSSFGGGMLGGAAVQIVISAVDDFSKTFNKSTTATQKLGKALKVAALGTAGAFAFMATKAANFERTTKAFETMLGSAEKAKDLLKEISDFTGKTPFQLEDIEENAKLLMGMGIETKKLIPTMKSLGDVASALNLPMERVALNFGQVKSQGKLMGTELRDFSRAGIPIIAELAKNLNLSESAIKGMSSQGKISFNDVEEAFRTMSSEGGQFNNFMVDAMDTTSGKISIFKDSVTQLSRSMGSMLLPSINKVVDSLKAMVDLFNNLDPETKSLVGKMALGTGATAIAGGATVKTLELINSFKGSTPANPIFTFQTNAGLGGVGGGLIGGIGGSIAASIGSISPAIIAGVSTAVSMVAVPLIAGKVVETNAFKKLWYGSETMDPTGRTYSLIGAFDAAKKAGSIPGYSKTADEKASKSNLTGNTIPSMYRSSPLAKLLYGDTADTGFVGPKLPIYTIELQDKITLEEMAKDLTAEQNLELINYLETIRGTKTEQERLNQQMNSGEISALEYSIKQNALNFEIEAAAKTAEAAIPGIAGFREEIIKLGSVTAKEAEDKKRFAASIVGSTMSESTFRDLQSRGIIGTDKNWTAGGSTSFSSGAGGQFNDFIMRPGQSAASFSPNDTIVGMKSIGGLGRGQNINVNIENVYGTDPDELSAALQNQLRNMVNV